MPDWRNSKDYEYTKDLTPSEWAWEFLRRNPEFLDDCEALAEAHKNGSPEEWAAARSKYFGWGAAGNQALNK